jgi:NADPH:quinone reductase-like Zn-dependent oxidoreductase
MRAAVYRRFGGPDVVQVEEWPKPEPKAGQVLVRVRATTVSMGDYRLRSRDLPKGMKLIGSLVLGIFAPRNKVLGTDLAGTIEAVGEGVTRFAPGDRVIALTGATFGGHAEYKVLREDAAITHAPANMDFEDAVALVFGGHTALSFLRRGDTRAGDEVLINGASGAVGTSAIQLAVARGATVTAVCSVGNADLVRSLGASHVIDYATEDFATSGKQYDAVMDCVGNAPFARAAAAVKPGGTLMLVVSDLAGMLGAKGNGKRAGIRVDADQAFSTAEILAELVQLAEAGKLRPVIDRRYRLDDIVEAHRYLDTNRKRGALVVSM